MRSGRGLMMSTVAALALIASAAPGAGDARAASPYRAGQNVNFYASQARCTTAFTVVFRLRRGRVRAGLTAGHCSRYPIRVAPGRYARERVWRVRGRNSPPATSLGLTLANTYRTGPDVLAFQLSGLRRVRRSVRVGGRSVRVVGSTRLGRGRRVCITGRASGTRCGRLLGIKRGRGSRRITCTSIRVRGGDSGAPVYTPPRNGRTRAVGLVKASRRVGGRRGMCYTPIRTALRALGARLG